MVTLNKPTFDTIIDLLVPHMDTVASRRSFVTQALHDAPTLLQRISYEGDAHQFTVNLVKTCSQYGQIAVGQSAIAALLTHLREQVGYDKQQIIDGLIAHIGVETRQADSIPTDLRENSDQVIEQGENAEQNMIMKILRDPLWQFVGVVIAVVAIVIGIFTSGGPENPEPPTPATPIVIALRDLDIRSGPGADFERLNILPVDSSLDILGISEDRLWYQILLQNGRTGWVLASSSGARLDGDRGVVNVIIPTLTPSHTPTDTRTPTSTITLTPSNTPTHTPTVTNTPTSTSTNTHTPTITDTPINTPTNTHTATVTNTLALTNTLEPSPTRSMTPTSRPVNTVTTQSVSGQYPCIGNIIDSPSSQLDIIRAQPRESAPTVRPVIPNEEVNVINAQRTDGILWYQIVYRSFTGWINQDDIDLNVNCP